MQHSNADRIMNSGDTTANNSSWWHGSKPQQTQLWPILLNL